MILRDGSFKKMDSINRLALIPARGGSKGVPNKNLQYVGSKSLLERAIDSAKNTNMFSEICVSTDSDAIAELANTHGASVPFVRPSLLSSDKALGIEVIRHAIDFYDSKGIKFSNLTLLQPTSPFRDANDVSSAVTLFESSQFQTLISILDVTNMQLSTLYQTLDLSEESGLVNLMSLENSTKVAMGTLRQDFHSLHWRNGAIYILKPENVQKYPVLLKDPIGGYAMDWLKSLNIDNPQDLEKARLLADKFGI
jgi:CMP-N-acetylneuraminic acid synthetase